MEKAVYSSARILVVDDEASSIQALTRILRAAGYEHVLSTSDPGEVLTLHREHDPDLIVLDWHMPGHDGLEVLGELRGIAPVHAYLPVLVLTGDMSSAVRRAALAAGAKDFVTKPFELDEILLRIHNLLQTRQLHRELTSRNRSLEERVAERTRELESAQLDGLERLAVAAEFRDDETGRHTERVGEAAALLAARLGLGDEECFLIRRAAPLHDIGKIGIPDAVLRKPGPLTPEEWAIMKRHADIGAQILAGGRSRIMRMAEEIAGFHHERWNGSGYPHGRAGEAIPLPARIVAVADVFDALTSNRVYRRAWPVEEVLTYIQTHAGQHFDPRIAALCGRVDVQRELVAIRARDREVEPVAEYPVFTDLDQLRRAG